MSAASIRLRVRMGRRNTRGIASAPESAAADAIAPNAPLAYAKALLLNHDAAGAAADPAVSARRLPAWTAELLAGAAFFVQVDSEAMPAAAMLASSAGGLLDSVCSVSNTVLVFVRALLRL